jgi:PAS domain S-box-containing protein
MDTLTDYNSLAEKLNDSSIDRVMAIDLSWNIIAWNKTSELVSGIEKAKVLGKNLLDAFPQLLADEEILQAIKDAFEGRKSFLPSNHSSFNRHYYENHFIPLKENNGRIIGVMNIMHDVAHRIKVEKQLQKLNMALEKKYQQLEKANNELATFTYITGRDIKEPLKHVYTSLEMLAKKEGQTFSNISRGNLRKMQASLNRMNLLLDDILAVSSIRGQNKAMEPVDLNEVLQEAKIILKGKTYEKRAVIESDHLPVVPGHRDMLVYLFQNIIDNSLKFQEENNTPRIFITSSIVTVDPESANDYLEDSDYVKISFSDNGIGFDQENGERIFNMFERLNERRFAGSGTGLTISKKIIEEHEGFIQVESKVNEGTTFHCYFPLNPEE